MTEKKKKIISAALEMFSENGYKGTATNQIAKKAKDALIVSIICDRGDRYISTGIFNK